MTRTAAIAIIAIAAGLALALGACVAEAGEQGALGETGQSCQATDNGDGSYTINCPDSAPVTVSDGPAGADGYDGASGADGQQGEQGPAGMDGAAGATGATGPQGPAGPQGEQGTPGEGFYGYACATDSQCNAALACSSIGICLLAENEGCLQSAQCATGFCKGNTCRPFGARMPSQDFDTLSDAGNNTPQGLWSDGATLWVANFEEAEFDVDAVYLSKIYAYDLATKARDEAKDFDTLIGAGNAFPYGLWSDGTTMWVADFIYHKVYAYNLTTKARDEAKDFDTLTEAGNTFPPYGLWSDGTTMWVADQSQDAYGFLSKIYAYNLATKARDAAKDFDTLVAAGNIRPTSLWSDGATMWVTDTLKDKVYAYNLATKARDAAKDLDTLIAADNYRPSGLWSDGATMWVADTGKNKLYAYEL